MNDKLEGEHSAVDDERLDRWLAAQPLLPSSPSFCDVVMSEIEQQSWWKRLKQGVMKSRTLQWNIPSAAMSFVFVMALGVTLYLFPGAQREPSEFAQLSDEYTYKELQNAAMDSPKLVQFRLQAPQAEQVELVGDFSQWQKRIPMRQKENGVWVVEIPLDGGSYEYAFVVDKARLIPDPKAQVLRDDGFGNRNSVRTVTSI